MVQIEYSDWGVLATARIGHVLMRGTGVDDISALNDLLKTVQTWTSDCNNAQEEILEARKNVQL